jgi:hypothetical protein
MQDKFSNSSNSFNSSSDKEINAISEIKKN